LTVRLRNSAWGLASVFALTGFMGYTLGPIVSHYLAMPNGHQVVMMAMGGTLRSSSGCRLRNGQPPRFQFHGRLSMAGIIVAFLAGLGAIFFAVPALALTVSAVFVLLMAGLILYQTSQIIHGGETNYIMATVTLYVSIYNLFTSLLHLLGVFNSNE
jgi:modulator of FtsH protease